MLIWCDTFGALVGSQAYYRLSVRLTTCMQNNLMDQLWTWKMNYEGVKYWVQWLDFIFWNFWCSPRKHIVSLTLHFSWCNGLCFTLQAKGKVIDSRPLEDLCFCLFVSFSLFFFSIFSQSISFSLFVGMSPFSEQKLAFEKPITGAQYLSFLFCFWKNQGEVLIIPEYS